MPCDSVVRSDKPAKPPRRLRAVFAVGTSLLDRLGRPPSSVDGRRVDRIGAIRAGELLDDSSATVVVHERTTCRNRCSHPSGPGQQSGYG